MRAFYLLCCAALASAQIRQYFIREPDNQTAIEGEQVSGSSVVVMMVVVVVVLVVILVVIVGT